MMPTTMDMVPPLIAESICPEIIASIVQYPTYRSRVSRSDTEDCCATINTIFRNVGIFAGQ
jgi:hypothetical protein